MTTAKAKGPAVFKEYTVEEQIKLIQQVYHNKKTSKLNHKIKTQ